MKCNTSPEPDGERIGKSQRTGGACASRATPSPPADLVTPVCREERATPSPQLNDTATPEGEGATARPAQPPAPRPVRVRPEVTSSVPEEAAGPEELQQEPAAPAAAAAAAAAAASATDEAEVAEAETQVEVTEDSETEDVDSEVEREGATGEDGVDEEDELTRLAVTLSNGAGQQATNVETSAQDDEEAASLALAMQLMQQEQALAQIYGGDQAAGYGFGVEEEEEAGGDNWIPAEEIEEVEVAEDALDESEATYEQLLELDEQKVVVGLSDQAKAGSTKIVTLSEPDVAALETLHDKRCCICLCDYEAGDELRQLPCSHACHVDCMDQHLAQAKTCPMCRTEVLTPRSSPVAREETDEPAAAAAAVVEEESR